MCLLAALGVRSDASLVIIFWKVMYREKFRSYGKFKACLPILFLCTCTHIHTNLQNVELTSFSTTDTRPLRRIYRKARTHSFTLKYWLFIVRDHIHKFEISTFFYNGIYQSEIHQLECFADILYCSFRDGKLVYYFIVSTRLYILSRMCMTKAVCVYIYNIHTYMHTFLPVIVNSFIFCIFWNHASG